MKRPRVLVFAYAAEPGRGSEPGAGWGVVRALEKLGDCTVLVGPEHSQAIGEWQAKTSDSTLSFVAVPEPSLARLAKIGQHRIPRFLLYLGWLGNARQVAERLHAEYPFDVTAHASWSVYWLPTPATQFGIPCLWGPVGGAVTTPFQLWPLLGWRGLLDELLDLMSVRLMARLLWTRHAWRGATVPIVQNEETLAQLPKALRARAWVLNHVVFTEAPIIVPRQRKSHILYFGGLQSRKGPTLAIRSLAHTPDRVHLRIAGEGPERSRLQRLARRINVSDRVEFLGSVPRESVFELLAEAAAVVFTGLREEGGMALAEAMLSGAPVIVLANGGARTIAASTTDQKRVMLVQPGSVKETAQRIGTAMTHFSQNPTSSKGPTIDQAFAHSFLRDRLEEAMLSMRTERKSNMPA